MDKYEALKMEVVVFENDDVLEQSYAGEDF